MWQWVKSWGDHDGATAMMNLEKAKPFLQPKIIEYIIK